MVSKSVCFVILFTIIPRTGGEKTNGVKCYIKNESDEIKNVCCADHEAKGDDCIACSKGYTSEIAGHCKPCSNNTYGDRCNHECFCSAMEICNIFEGCVELAATGMSVDESPDTTKSPMIQDITTNKQSTDKMVKHATTTQTILDESTQGKSFDNTVHELFSTEMIVIITLSVVVVLFGICLCFIFFKYELVAKWKKNTFFQSSIPQNSQCDHNIEIEDRLYHVYNIINDADMLDDTHVQEMQLQMSSSYLDVIHDPSSTESSKRINEVNHAFACNYSPSSETKTHENKIDCNSLTSSDTTSTSDVEHQDTTQDYLNPYQPLIHLSPEEKGEYLTLTTVHRIDSKTLNYKTDEIAKKECELHHPLQLKNVGIVVLRAFDEYENFPNKLKCRNSKQCFSPKKGQLSNSCDNLNIKHLQKRVSKDKEDIHFNSTEDNKIACYKAFKSKSESDIYHEHVRNK